MAPTAACSGGTCDPSIKHAAHMSSDFRVNPLCASARPDDAGSFSADARNFPAGRTLAAEMAGGIGAHALARDVHNGA